VAGPSASARRRGTPTIGVDAPAPGAVLRDAVDLAETPESPRVPGVRAGSGDNPGEDPWGWTWPPGGPLPPAGGPRWTTEAWAPASTVRRPLVRLGRWTLLYRRAGA
jgi:hypothetical protein